VLENVYIFIEITYFKMAYRQMGSTKGYQNAMSYRGAYNTAKPTGLCTVNQLFNEEHLDKSGFWCKQKHIMYFWTAHTSSDATIIGDSLVKWVRGLKYTDTQSTPGLTLSWAFDRIQQGIIDVSRYQIILLLIGTNDLDKFTPDDIGEKMLGILNLIKKINPQARLAVCGLLYRPQDFTKDMEIINSRPHIKHKWRPRRLINSTCVTHTKCTPWRPNQSQPQDVSVSRDIPGETLTPTTNHLACTNASYSQPPPLDYTVPMEDLLDPKERKRRDANKALRKACRFADCFFLESWKKVFDDCGDPILDLYCDDGLHLSSPGIISLGNYLQGNVAALKDRNKRVRLTKNEKRKLSKLSKSTPM
jgi:hypothetical protein